MCEWIYTDKAVFFAGNLQSLLAKTDIIAYNGYKCEKGELSCAISFETEDDVPFLVSPFADRFAAFFAPESPYHWFCLGVGHDRLQLCLALHASEFCSPHFV